MSDDKKKDRTKAQSKNEAWKQLTKDVARLESEYNAAVSWTRYKLGEAVQIRRVWIEAEERQVQKQKKLKQAQHRLDLMAAAMREELMAAGDIFSEEHGDE